MQLPEVLEPWRAWLVLFSPDLIATLSDLLMRMQPLVGKLGNTALHGQDLPVGVGSIARRGSYERMLLTEWAFADAEPDEFIRRAGSGELLFTGPEPDGRKNTLRSVAIFDAGPAQLGEPRLAHIALFILLARRAQDANALFQWGTWQKPGILHTDTGLIGLKVLLSARTLEAATVYDTDAWNETLGDDLNDCWMIGANKIRMPDRAKSHVFITPAWLENQLEVTLTRRQDTRKLSLNLPDPALGVRLLRQPFDPVAPKGNIRLKNGRPSLKQPPRFATHGSLLAVPQLDGATLIFHVPQSTRAEAGNYRVQAPVSSGHVLAAGVFKKNLSYVVARDEDLVFYGFPGRFLASPSNVRRPDMKIMRAPPGLARWLQVFYLHSPNVSLPRESVLMLDIEEQLVCWEFTTARTPDSASSDVKASSQPASKVAFRSIAHKVIGAAQFGSTVFFGCGDDDGFTQLYQWQAVSASIEKTHRLPRRGRELLFGRGSFWARNSQGLLALRLNDTEWWVGDISNAELCHVEDNSLVLGVALSKVSEKPGLVLLHPSKTRIELCVGRQRYILVASQEPIGQACVDPATGRLAWITSLSRTLIVRNLDEEKHLLRVTADEVQA